MSNIKKMIPAFKADNASKRRALRIRTIYKRVLGLLFCAKQKRPRKASLICSKLVNSEEIQWLPRTRMFIELVTFHTENGKFKKASYKTLLRAAPMALHELELLIAESRFLIKKKKPTLSIVKTEIEFNSTEDIASVKDFGKVVESDAPKLKSVSSDDKLVMRTLNSQERFVVIDHDEIAMVKRGVYFNGVKIPKEAWKKVFVSIGLQRIASQYVTAVFCPVLAVPAWDGSLAYSPNALLNTARQHIAMHNRTVKNPNEQLAVVGDMHKVEAHSHAWFLCLPKVLVNDPNFRFGTWTFTEMPRAVSSAQQAVAA